jgi:hypothetical protein
MVPEGPDADRMAVDADNGSPPGTDNAKITAFACCSAAKKPKIVTDETAERSTLDVLAEDRNDLSRLLDGVVDQPGASYLNRTLSSPRRSVPRTPLAPTNSSSPSRCAVSTTCPPRGAEVIRTGPAFFTSARVTAKVTYTPAGGNPRTKVKGLKLVETG